MTIVSILILLVLIIGFPKSANFNGVPGVSEWYLYSGGVLGVVILAAPIFLIPRLGATATLTALVVGQLFLALITDRLGYNIEGRVKHTVFGNVAKGIDQRPGTSGKALS